MKYNKNQYQKNEKLLYKSSLGILLGSIILFGVTVLVLRNFDFLAFSLNIFTGFGMLFSICIVIIGNIRLIRYVFIIRKADTTVNVWKSAISVAYGLGALVVYWFILLLLLLQSF